MTTYSVKFWKDGQEDFKKDGGGFFTKKEIFSNFENEERPDRDEIWENDDGTIGGRSDVTNFLYTPVTE